MGGKGHGGIRSAGTLAVCVVLLAPQAAAAAPPNTWNRVADMAFVRGHHTLTTLADGRVLAAGGSNSSPDFSELYDPARNRWGQTRAMPAFHRGHSAILLRNGKVLLVGGNSSGLASVYDPAANAWALTGNRTAGGRTAVRLHDGRVLAVGESDAELYDPTANSWTRVPDHSAHQLFTTTLLPNRRVLVLGGFQRANSAQLFNPSSRSWTPARPPAARRFDHTATLLRSGKVLVAGGPGPGGNGQTRTNRAELYDPATNRWTAAASMRIARGGHTAVLLRNGKVLVAGGIGRFGEAVWAVELYDPERNRWTMAPELFYQGLPAFALLHSGQVMRSGGFVSFGGAPEATRGSVLYTPERPRVTALVMAPFRFRPAATGASGVPVRDRRVRSGGAIVRYRADQPLVVTFTVARPAPGVVRGRRCVSGRGGSSCTRLVVVGSFTQQATTGQNSFRFTGRIGGRPLAPGLYSLGATPRDPSGNDGQTPRVLFRIIP